jgi:hypothetical protein
VTASQVTLFGVKLPSPILVAPLGVQGILHKMVSSQLRAQPQASVYRRTRSIEAVAAQGHINWYASIRGPRPDQRSFTQRGDRRDDLDPPSRQSGGFTRAVHGSRPHRLLPSSSPLAIWAPGPSRSQRCQTYTYCISGGDQRYAYDTHTNTAVQPLNTVTVRRLSAALSCTSPSTTHRDQHHRPLPTN